MTKMEFTNQLIQDRRAKEKSRDFEIRMYIADAIIRMKKQPNQKATNRKMRGRQTL